MDDALEGLIGKLDGQLVLIVLAGTQTRHDGAVFALRVDVDKGGEGGHTLGDLIFKEKAEAAVEIFFSRFALQPIQRIPLLLQRAGAAHFKHVGRERIGTVGVCMRVDPAARGFDRRLDHVADRQRGVISRGH